MRFLLVVLLSILSLYIKSQSSWSKSSFYIDQQNPNMLFSDSNWLYVGGFITSVNGQVANRIFRVSKTGVVDLMDVSTPTSNSILGAIRYNDTTYFLGTRGLHYYSSNLWNNKLLTNGFIHGAILYNNNFLIVGGFTDVSSTGDGLISEYDGVKFNQFNRIDTVLNVEQSQIYCVSKFDGKVYFGGNFDNSQYREIISWDGLKWDNLKGGILGNSKQELVNSIVEYNDDLYVGGQFSKDEGSISNNILKWNGNQWESLGNGIMGKGGINGSVIYKMYVYENELWVLGQFDSVDNMSVNNVVIWNGSYWCRPKGSFDRNLNCITEFNDTLYVGGNFRNEDGDTLKRFVVKHNKDIDRECQDSIPLPTSISENNSISKSKIYPNPNDGNFFIEVEKPTNVDIYSINGQYLNTYYLSTTNYSINLPESFKDGLYFLVYNSNQMPIVKKFILKRN